MIAFLGRQHHSKPKTLTLGTGNIHRSGNRLHLGDANSDTAVAWLKELLTQAIKKPPSSAIKNSAQFYAHLVQDTAGSARKAIRGCNIDRRAITAATSTGQFMHSNAQAIVPAGGGTENTRPGSANHHLERRSITGQARFSWRARF